MSGRDAGPFKLTPDGRVLERAQDGSFRPVPAGTDVEALDRLSDDEIDALAASDPDHPALDDAFWAGADALPPRKEAISIKIDADVLAWFRGQGRGYQTRINAVLRRFVDVQRRAGRR